MFAVLCAAFLILQQAGRDPLLRFQIGMDAVRNGDGETVFREAGRLLKTSGFESSGHMLRGTWFLQEHSYDAAADEFGLATENPETRVEACTRCGEALYRMQKFVDAERMLLLALQYDESNSDARRWLASTYYDLGIMSSALEHLKIIGTDNPSDGRPYRLRGLIEKDFKQFGDAVTEYETALKRELPPAERQAVLLELSDCLVHQLRYDEALKTLTSAPRSAETLSLEAQCYAALGKLDEATNRADEAIRLNPNHVPAILTKAGIALENGQAETVRPILEAAAKTHPNDFDILFQLIKAWRLTGRTAQADAHSAKLAELEKLIDQFAALNTQTFTDLTNADLRFQLAQLAFRLDRPELAGSWLQAALAIDPQHTEARKLLESIQNEHSKIPD